MGASPDFSNALVPANTASATPDFSNALVASQAPKSGGWLSDAVDAAGNVLQGLGEGELGQPTAAVARLLRAVPVVGPKIVSQQDLDRFNADATPQGGFQGAGAFAGNVADASALGAVLPEGYIAQTLGNAALAGGSTLAAGGSPKDAAIGAGIGAVGGAAGTALANSAEGMASSALGFNAASKRYGREPAQALLNETTGTDPAAIAKQAEAKISQYANQLESMVSGSKTPVSTQSALDVVDGALKKAASQNNKSQFDALKNFRLQLTHNFQTGDPLGQPIQGQTGSLLSPLQALDLKRGVGDTANWQAQQGSGIFGTIKQAYNRLDEAIDAAVPGTAELNQKISNLLPVARRASAVDLNADLTQRVMHRVGAHTGALASSILGGEVGGPVGAIVAPVLQEAVSSPQFKTGLARGLQYAPDLSRPVSVSLSDLLGQQQEGSSNGGQ